MTCCKRYWTNTTTVYTHNPNCTQTKDFTTRQITQDSVRLCESTLAFSVWSRTVYSLELLQKQISMQSEGGRYGKNDYASNLRHNQCNQTKRMIQCVEKNLENQNDLHMYIRSLAWLRILHAERTTNRISSNERLYACAKFLPPETWLQEYIFHLHDLTLMLFAEIRFLQFSLFNCANMIPKLS